MHRKLFATSADACDEGGNSATFDLSNLEPTVNGGTANTVNWFEDAAATIPLTSPLSTNTTTIFAVVGDGNCISNPVAVDLNVTDAPQAFATSADACDEGGNAATFDLTTLEPTVNGGTANTVNWFEDAAATIPLTSPLSTNTTTIFAVVGDGNCISNPVAVDLNVTDAPQAFATSADACDEGGNSATFDLSNLEPTVNGGTANAVNWFEDQAATIPLTSPLSTNTTTIFAVVGDGNCISNPVAVDLNVTDAPQAFATSADACDEGGNSATFNLTTLESTVNGGTANTVNWFEDAAATIPLTSPLSTNTTTIFAVVGDGNCISNPVAVDLNVTDAPQAFATSADACDEGGNSATFDLSNLEPTVNGGTANTVNWFEDAAATIPLTSPLSTNTTTIFAVVGDGNCISNPVAVDLNVTDAPQAFATSADACDEGGNSATFDLSNLEPTVNGGTANVVNWFEDAAATIPLTSPLSTNTTTIFAVVGDGNCISNPVAVDLNVTNAPQAFATSADACDEGGKLRHF